MGKSGTYPVKNIRGVDIAFDIPGDPGSCATVMLGDRRGPITEHPLAAQIAEAWFAS